VIWASAGIVEIGLVIDGRYRLRERLGRGGMSVVWRAVDDVLGREVAVKVLTVDLVTDPKLLRQLRGEARAAAGLRHPHVVAVHDYGETVQHGQTLPYVVMELVDGRSLHDLLSGGALPWQVAVTVGAQVAAALAAAHERGIVHRDVKPGNVMVTASGVKLVDFGISAAVGEIDGSDGQLLGTPAYLAPERIEGGPVRPATDVYALGLLLYRALAGTMPWDAATSTQMLKAHLWTEAAPLPSVPGMPSEVARILRRCLAKQPAERPTAAQVAQSLADLVGLTPVRPLHAVTSQDTAMPGLRTWTRSRRRIVLGAAMAVTLLSGGAITWMVHDASDQPPTAAAAPPEPQSACAIGYTIRSATGGRASTTVTIHNTGPTPVPEWQLRFTLPHGQRLVRGWTSGWRQIGSAVQAGGGPLPSGATVHTGFDATYQQATALPDSFRLNGTDCHAEMAVTETRPVPVSTHTPPQRSAGTQTGRDTGGSDSGPAKTKQKEKKEKKEEKQKGEDDDGDDQGDDD
jgi:serine/threonine-protein kinase